MPKDNFGNSYEYKNSGTNDQGDHYCARDPGPDASNQNTYHYSNSDGSYYYSNSDGSTYHNDGQGSATYNPPGSSSEPSKDSSSAKK